MKQYDIGIIGGGASGTMAAIIAGRAGKSVAIFEKNPAIGRKILATGNGRCNLTNKNIQINRYYGSNINLIKYILERFDETKTISFFESLGLILKEEENGRIFPRTNQASSVLKVLEDELKRLNINIKTESKVEQISKNKSWKIEFAEGEPVICKNLIIATGGKASHHLGSSGDGIFWSKKLGHNIIPIYPSLVPIETIETWPKEMQGLKINAKVKMTVDGKIVSEKTDDLLFTHYGISGPAVMGQARFIAPWIEKCNVEVQIDTYPEGNLKELDDVIRKLFDASGSKSVKNALSGLAPVSLIQTVLKNNKIDPTKKAAIFSKEERLLVARSLKEMVLTVKSLRPFKEAQVSMGGVDLKEVDENLESKKIKSLFFCGEVLDVDADSGGFNLQWAWSSGFLAGKSAAKN